MPHLLVDISAHGYGHVAQTAPVVSRLAQLVPDLHVTVRSAAPAALLQQRFQCEFRHVPAALDFGMAMVSAVEVDVAQSLAAYRAYHADWDGKVARAADDIRALRPDLLLANVPYLSLAAARLAGVPSLAMCCLNWADIYASYAEGDDCHDIHAQMLDAYRSAAHFLKIQPTMPMPGLDNAHNIGPIAQQGHDRRAMLAERGWGAGDEKLVLVAMGGIEFRLPMESWPRISGVRWLVPASWNIERVDMAAFDVPGLPFGDLLASCDAVLTKPGYGTFAEAACAGIPVLYVSRGRWPEQPYLAEWLQRHGVCMEVAAERLQSGELADLLQELWSRPKPPLPANKGVEQAAAILAGMF